MLQDIPFFCRVERTAKTVLSYLAALFEGCRRTTNPETRRHRFEFMPSIRDTWQKIRDQTLSHRLGRVSTCSAPVEDVFPFITEPQRKTGTGDT